MKSTRMLHKLSQIPLLYSHSDLVLLIHARICFMPCICAQLACVNATVFDFLSQLTQLRKD